jgi:hypothetical protein
VTYSDRVRAPDFPPSPTLRGRATELTTLARTVLATRPTRLALVGPGGSGKSVLAAALGHRMRRHFGGRVHWVRVGAWDFRTLIELLALRFGAPRTRTAALPALRALFEGQQRLIVLDNHEDDRATARLLDAFAGTNASFLITARRCLLGGVLVFPVTAPLVTAGRSAFPRVKRLTRLLRWNPLALDIADAIVGARAATVGTLERDLLARGVDRVRTVEHEDDVPEVALLVDWAWRRLSAASRRVLAVLAHVEGDHVDVPSITTLARLGARTRAALAPLVRLRLVQEHFRGRFALHAVVRHAVRKRTRFDPARLFAHYVGLLERDPERLAWEQTNLFAAMDHAHRTGDMSGMLRVEALLARLESGRP